MFDKIISIWIGTRPELIKMAPVIHELRKNSGIKVRVILTGQHLQLMDDALVAFSVEIDRRFNLMKIGQSLLELDSAIGSAFLEDSAAHRPDLVLVHGDTITASKVAIMAFLSGIPVCHTEAGLRSGSLQAPWPEEGNRRIIDAVSSLHLAPTPRSFQLLINEGHSETAFLTGNSIVDALDMSLKRIKNEPNSVSRVSILVEKYPERPVVVVTQHRREKFGVAIRQVFEHVNQLAKLGMHVIVPLHLNPEVRSAAAEVFCDQEGISLVEPLNYLEFVKLLSIANLVISDSGGIQEECPTLGVPILITRNSTERPEIIECGLGLLVGENGDGIPNGFAKFLRLRDSTGLLPQVKTPFGEIGSSKLIADACFKYVSAR